ncbi:NAD(P)-dependent oxidoreductase [Curvivirga aplysinae]|uniref:NAD(P)-dependent oxidoreductase n=1 Tax=Curvivirga aplysinae TaxID=2529852 RepID=UPI0012BD4064|nr:NAD(P)-dependent oxidoreductase [Curvivirga aplysinae]MTI11496.1 NAD(P)-dependent oxidoreductase [Curvivirga aplysinae]
MKVGFVGLGNVGSKLAGSLLRNGYDVTVRDLNEDFVNDFVNRGAKSASSPKELAENCDVVITCLPSPSACSQVMEAEDGIIAGLSEGKVWMEMSTTDETEVRRIADKVEAIGAFAVDCPVSGGCHRADTGNISIFAGCKREAFDKVLPILTTMGRRILHTGEIGSASVLKVVTNYLATANLVSIAEALTACKVLGMDMNVSYEAIKASSGNSFVHETESQVILNGSRDINFTMDLVSKDVGIFHELTKRKGMDLEIAPLLVNIFKDGEEKFGSRELSPNIIRRIEEPCGVKVLGEGFPPEMVDDEPEEKGYEVVIEGRKD